MAKTELTQRQQRTIKLIKYGGTKDKPITAAHIGRVLRINDNTVRAAICKIRRRGISIQSKLGQTGGYWLEETKE